MHPLPKNLKKGDTDSTFDFLHTESDEGGEKSVSEAVDPAQSEQSSDEPSAADQSGRNKFIEYPFPVIRKPVSVNKSGALKAPQENEPVEPPPLLTSAVRSTRRLSSEPLRPTDTPDFDDLDDLGNIFEREQQEVWPGSETWIGKKENSDSELWLDEQSASGHEKWVEDGYGSIGEQYRGAQFREPGSRWASNLGYTMAFVFISAGLLAILYSLPQARQWSQDTVAKVSDLISPVETESEPALAELNSVDDTESSESVTTSSPLVDRQVDSDVNSQKSLYTLFNEELAKIESLLVQEEFDAVENALQSMDPLVFGYGSAEFTDIENKLASLREPSETTDRVSSSASDLREQLEREAAEALAQQEQAEGERSAEEARLAEQQLLEQEQAEQLARNEQAALAKVEEERRLALERQAAEAAQAEQIRADRLAEEKARAEQFRIALEERERNEQRLEEQRLEEQRLEALRIEEERLAELRAEVQSLEEQRLEEQRLAEQRAEEQRLAEQRLAEQRAEEQRLAELREQELRAEEQRLAELLEEEQRLEEQRLAVLREEEIREEERRLARQAAEELAQSEEAIAARQREAARQQRLADARAREAQQESDDVESVSESSGIPVENLELALVDSSVLQNTTSSVRPIAESELQQVYRQFSELERAIESRDINAVVALTESSGSRVQQVLQIFENNVSIEAQLRNVSTLDSAGEIRGTLQITRLQRVDGSVTGPPSNFDSVPILSVRRGDVWSQIRW